MADLPNASEAYLAQAITALGADRFSEKLCDWLNQCLDIDNFTILAYYQTRKPELFYRKSRIRQVHERLEADYLSGAYLLDPFHDLHVKKTPEGMYRLKDCAPDHFHRNEYFARYYGYTTMIDELCYHACPARGVSVQVCLGKDKSSGRMFSARDLRSAEKLVAIVCSMIKKQWKDLSASGDYTDDSLVEKLQRQLKEHRDVSLSKRQCEVALLILRGHSTISIGLALSISPQTVKVFRKQLYRKCQISSQAELFSLMSGLLAL